jgi:hypothetical protein
MTEARKPGIGPLTWPTQSAASSKLREELTPKRVCGLGSVPEPIRGTVRHSQS